MVDTNFHIIWFPYHLVSLSFGRAICRILDLLYLCHRSISVPVENCGSIYLPANDENYLFGNARLIPPFLPIWLGAQVCVNISLKPDRVHRVDNHAGHGMRIDIRNE